MKKIACLLIVLMILPSVIAGYGGGSPGSSGTGGGGTGGSAGGGALTTGGLFQGQKTIMLGLGEYNRFDLFGQRYMLKIVEFNPSNVLVSISPTGVLERVNIGATRRFDLNRNGLEDFLVRFENIRNGKAVLIYAVVFEKAAVETGGEEPVSEEVILDEEPVSEEDVITWEEIKEKGFNYWFVIIVLGLILIIYIWHRMREHELKKRRKR